MDFLERYKRVAAVVTATSLKKKCGRCDEILSISQFSVDKKRQDGIALRCKHCHRELCEKSRVKKRVWHSEDQHYQMPGGYGAPFKKRLAAFYAEMP